MSRCNTYSRKIAFEDHPFVVAETKCRSAFCTGSRDNPPRIRSAIPNNSHHRQIDARTSCASLPPQSPPCLHPPHDIIQSLLPEEHVRAIYSLLSRNEETMMRFSRPYPSSVHGFEVFLPDRTQNADDYVQHP